MPYLVLTFLFSFKIEGSVDSDRGSVIDSEEKDEEVSDKSHSTSYFAQAFMSPWLCVRPLATLLFHVGPQDNIAQCLFPMLVVVNVFFIIILMQ